jgi:hypothetical protein
MGDTFLRGRSFSSDMKPALAFLSALLAAAWRLVILSGAAPPSGVREVEGSLLVFPVIGRRAADFPTPAFARAVSAHPAENTQGQSR